LFLTLKLNLNKKVTILNELLTIKNKSNSQKKTKKNKKKQFTK